MSASLRLPPFALILLKRQVCPSCNAHLTPRTVVAAGVRVHSDGMPHFYYETLCSRCAHPSMTIVTSRPVNGPNWATAIAPWLDKPQDSPASATPTQRPVPLRHLTLVVAGRPLRRFDIYGGYRRGRSNFLLLGRPSGEPSSIFRACADGRITRDGMYQVECLPKRHWTQFLALADGHTFELGQCVGRKLTRVELELLVRDKLFRNEPFSSRRRRKR